MYIHVRIQRGGGGGNPPPPPRFVRGGVLYGCLVERKGVQMWFDLINYHYFLARFARSPAAYISKNFKNPNQFHAQRTWNGHLLSQHIIHFQLMIPGFHKSAFCLNLHDLVPFKTTTIYKHHPPPKKKKLSTN